MATELHRIFFTSESNRRTVSRERWYAAYADRRSRDGIHGTGGTEFDATSLRASTCLIVDLKQACQGLNLTVIVPRAPREKIYIQGPTGKLP